MVKVNYAVLHNAPFVKDLGELNKTLDSAAFSKERAFSMAVSENSQFLIIDVKGRTNGKPYTLHVPMTNVSHFTIEKE